MQPKKMTVNIWVEMERENQEGHERFTGKTEETGQSTSQNLVIPSELKQVIILILNRD